MIWEQMGVERDEPSRRGRTSSTSKSLWGLTYLPKGSGDLSFVYRLDNPRSLAHIAITVALIPSRQPGCSPGLRHMPFLADRNSGGGKEEHRSHRCNLLSSLHSEEFPLNWKLGILPWHRRSVSLHRSLTMSTKRAASPMGL